MADFFVDEIMKQLLDDVRKKVTQKDFDFTLIIDGPEGSGKSLLAMQICKYLDPSFDIDRIHFDSDTFIKQLTTLPKHSAILLDEAFLAASARGSMSEVNRTLVAVSTEMRQRNNFVVLCLPSFFDLDRYFALWRCKTLVHVYLDTKTGNRGQYILFPERHKRLLYLLGKKTYSYRAPRSPFPPMEFRNQYPIDEQAYKEKKAEAFRSRQELVGNGGAIRAKQHKQQRDMLIRFLHNEGKLSHEQISNICNLTTQQIYMICKEEDNV